MSVGDLVQVAAPMIDVFSTPPMAVAQEEAELRIATGDERAGVVVLGGPMAGVRKGRLRSGRQPRSATNLVTPRTG